MKVSTYLSVALAVVGMTEMLTVEAAVLGPVVTSDGTHSIRTDGGFTVGYRFTVGASDMTVDALGIWDGANGGGGDGADGLLVAHDVGLWKSDGTPIASVTVPAGELPLTRIGEFLYKWLPAPVVLTAGADYRVGAYYATGDLEPFRDQTPSATLSAAVTSYGANYVGGASLADPVVASFPSHAFVGPNLNVIENLVPEPSCAWLLATGWWACYRYRSRKHRAAAV